MPNLRNYNFAFLYFAAAPVITWYQVSTWYQVLGTIKINVTSKSDDVNWRILPNQKCHNSKIDRYFIFHVGRFWKCPACEIIISLFYIWQRRHFEMSAELKMPQFKNWLYVLYTLFVEVCVRQTGRPADRQTLIHNFILSRPQYCRLSTWEYDLVFPTLATNTFCWKCAFRWKIADLTWINQRFFFYIIITHRNIN